MADIVLVQPIVGLIDNIKSSPAFPLSLVHAASLVINEFSVILIDQRLEQDWEIKLLSELKKKPLCVGTTCMLGTPIQHALKISTTVKNYSTDIPVIWGGAHASTLPEITLQDPNIDIVVLGDGEETFLQLARALKNGISLNTITGLWYKKNGIIQKNEQRPRAELSTYPDIPYDLVNVNNYLPLRFGKPALDLESSRGCPYRCTFCYNPTMNLRKWRAWPAEKILERVKRFKDKYGVEAVWFVDDEFFINLKRARKIIEGLVEIGVQYTIQGITIHQGLAMEDSFIKLLNNSGCLQLNFGAESGSDRILKMVSKGISRQDIIDCNRKFRKVGISPWYYFMIGFPTETTEEMKETLRFACSLLEENPDAKISGIGCYTPYPGTPLFDESKKFGYVPPDKLIEWTTYSVDHINIPWLSQEQKKIVRMAQFTSFFADDKRHDISAPWYIKVLGALYKPFARFRMKHCFLTFPFEIFIGEKFKEAIHRRIRE
jgi:radical SAM superfamily enzyme YgiQ (UPF0313 family)